MLKYLPADQWISATRVVNTDIDTVHLLSSLPTLQAITLTTVATVHAVVLNPLSKLLYSQLSIHTE